MKMQQQAGMRLEWVDILRGVGIISVIIGHLRHMIPDDALINTVIYSFHMPLFLLVSGYLFAAKCKENANANVFSFGLLIRKYKTIMVPYFLFSLFSLVYSLPSNEYTAKEMLVGILAGGGANVSRVNNIALWFLPMFFLATIFFTVIHTFSAKFKNKTTRGISLTALTLVASFFGYWIIEKSNSRYFFWSIDVALLTQGYFLCGYFFHKFEEKKNHILMNIGLMALSGIVWVVLISWNGRVDLNARQIGNVFLYYLCGVSGTLFLYLFCKIIVTKIPVVSTILAWCGKNSLLIMGLHLPISMLIYSGLSDFLPFSQYVWEKNLTGVLYIVAYIILFVFLIKMCFFKPIISKAEEQHNTEITQV